jgi:hypothetical protein
MVQFLNTASAYSEIENIVNRAEKKLVLISPYIRLSRLLYQRLYHASENRNINITIVCRKKDLKQEELIALNKITRLEIIDLPNLHAKCFFNEKSMVISSLNLYEYAQANNREMGVLLTQEKEPEAFTDAIGEAEFMMQIAYKVEADRMMLRLGAQRKPAENVSFFDVQAGLRRSFPTFTKMLAHTKEAARQN